MRAVTPRRHVGFALVLALAACSTTKVTEETQPPGLTLSLLPAEAPVPVQSTFTVLVTVTRVGGYTGAVNVTVTGGFANLDPVVSDVQTTGTKTTALISFTPVLGISLAPHEFVVHVTGAGVAEKTAPVIITVTQSDSPNFGVFIANNVITLAAGGTIDIPITLFRNHYTGPIFLVVDNLPVGVTAQFNPASPIVPPTGDEVVLTLTAAATAPPGTFAHLAVHTSAPATVHLADELAPLSLTITAPGPSAAPPVRP